MMMSTVTSGPCREATELLTKLSRAERDYILSQLIQEKLEGEVAGAKVLFHAPDGTLCGLFQLPQLPTDDIISVMSERSRSIRPGTGHPMSALLELMESNNENGVKSFIKH